MRPCQLTKHAQARLVWNLQATCLNRAFFCAVQAPAKQLHAFAERQLQPLTQVCRCNAVAFQNEFDAAV